MPQTLLYFAYGSNLHPLRLRERVPSSEARYVARIDGYRLCFNKRGRDGSGKCNIVPSGRCDDLAYGVVYRILRDERALLDLAEGLGQGYCHLSLRPVCGERRLTAFAYAAEAGHTDDGLRPFSWYKSLVVEGARWHGLPEDYLAALCAVDAELDPDARRRAEHARILRSLPSTRGAGVSRRT